MEEITTILKHAFPNHSVETIQSVINEVHMDDGTDDPLEYQFDRITTLLLNLDTRDMDEASPEDRNALREKCQRILDLFPDASVEYCKTLILKNIPLSTIKKMFEDDGYKLESEQPVTNESEEQEGIFLKLTEMLPKYDPDYLKEKAETLIGETEEHILDVIHELLDEEEYPTIEEYNTRNREKLACVKYTTNFYIHEFVKEFPDPSKFFEKLNRKHSLNKVDDLYIADDIKYARTVLYNHYNFLRMNDIDIYMDTYKNDIIRVCVKLDKLPKAFKTNRKPMIEIPTNYKNVLMFQELAYVKYRVQVKNYIKMKNEAYQEALKLAREAGLLETCQCCFHDELIPEECFTCMKGCIFCKDCVKLGIETLIGDGKLAFPCFTENCSAAFSMKTLQLVLDPVVFYFTSNRIQSENLKNANVDGFEMCPFCDFGTVVQPDDKIFNCRNEKCLKESCRECKHESHIPLRCNEIEYEEDVKMRTYIENKMTDGLLRTCQTCKKKFIKDTGCNKMVCPCGATLCYLCGAPNISYTHFQNTSCSLTSDDVAVHKENVATAAKKAKVDLGVDIDPSKLKFDPTRNM